MIRINIRALITTLHVVGANNLVTWDWAEKWKVPGSSPSCGQKLEPVLIAVELPGHWY